MSAAGTVHAAGHSGDQQEGSDQDLHPKAPARKTEPCRRPELQRRRFSEAAELSGCSGVLNGREGCFGGCMGVSRGDQVYPAETACMARTEPTNRTPTASDTSSGWLVLLLQHAWAKPHTPSTPISQHPYRQHHPLVSFIPCSASMALPPSPSQYCSTTA